MGTLPLKGLIFLLQTINEKNKLFKTGLLPLSYWHKYLDLVYLFKAIKLNDSQISIVSNDRITRCATTNSVTLKISRVNTLTFQNSFYNRAPRIYNSLPPQIREASVTVGQFKSYLLTYYEAMTKQIYNINTPQTFKSICVKCHSCRPLSSLVDNMCCKCSFLNFFLYKLHIIIGTL